MLCGVRADNNYLYPGILRCPSCGLVYSDLHLSREQAVQLYGRKYFFGDEYFNYPEERRVFSKNFRRRIEILKKFSPGGKLFEIGCAYGFFLEEARPFWRVAGCDLFAQACTSANERGLNVTCEDFLELPLEDGTFDVVALWDTIEHLSRPDLYFEKISRLLRKDGIVALTTGDIGSLTAKLRGGRWRLIHPPTHLYYFDRRTISRLLKRVGIEVIHFEHCGFYRSLSQILYSILLLGRRRPWQGRAEHWLKSLSNLSVYINLYDIMMVIGRKT
jgi:SAM-dependent methyltransferase